MTIPAPQSDINDRMRAILIDWLVDVHLKFKVASCLEASWFVLAVCDYMSVVIHGRLWYPNEALDWSRIVLAYRFCHPPCCS